MIGAQDPLKVGEGPLEQRDRLGCASRRLVGHREVVAGSPACWVVGAQDPLDGLRGSAQAAGSPRPYVRPPGRRPRGCCGSPGCRGGRCPGPARSRRGSAQAAGSPWLSVPHPGRPARGCCGIAGCRGGRRPEPAHGRQGSARTAGSPRPCVPPPGRRRPSCCGQSGCRGGRRPVLFAVGGQRFRREDRLASAVTKHIQQVNRPQTQPQQARRHLTGENIRVASCRCPVSALTCTASFPDPGRIAPRLAYPVSHPPRTRTAPATDRRQPPVGDQPLPHHPHHQPVRQPPNHPR